MDARISERYRKSSLCFHKHHTRIMTTCGTLHVEIWRQPTLDAMYKKMSDIALAALLLMHSPKGGSSVNKACVNDRSSIPVDKDILSLYRPREAPMISGD